MTVVKREFYFRGGWPAFRKFLEPSCRIFAEELRLFHGIQHDGFDDCSPPERHAGYRFERRGRQLAVLSVYIG